MKQPAAIAATQSTEIPNLHHKSAPSLALASLGSIIFDTIACGTVRSKAIRVNAPKSATEAVLPKILIMAIPICAWKTKVIIAGCKRVQTPGERLVAMANRNNDRKPHIASGKTFEVEPRLHAPASGNRL